jgi:hypothetical protein
MTLCFGDGLLYTLSESWTIQGQVVGRWMNDELMKTWKEAVENFSGYYPRIRLIKLKTLSQNSQCSGGHSNRGPPE